MERSGLTLLELGDSATKRPLSQTILPTRASDATTHTSVPSPEPNDVTSDVEPQTIVPPIAQNDTLVERLQWRGDTGKTGKVLIGVSIACIAVGILSILPLTRLYLAPVSTMFGNAFFLLIGTSMLALTLILLLSLVVSQTYWRRIGTLRLRAFSHVQTGTRTEETGATTASVIPLPQPTSVRLRYNRILMFFFSFFVTLILAFIFFSLFSHPNNHVTVSILSLSCALFVGLLQARVFVKANEKRIEVSEQGISTNMNLIYSSIRWKDVRLFSRYRTVTLLRKKGKMVIYELAGEKTVVRLMGAERNWNFFVTEPKMGRAEFERWQKQLQAYIEQRTHLPLIDLDDLDQVKSDTSIERS